MPTPRALASSPNELPRRKSKSLFHVAALNIDAGYSVLWGAWLRSPTGPSANSTVERPTLGISRSENDVAPDK